jgi:hypothetical protein
LVLFFRIHIGRNSLNCVLTARQYGEVVLPDDSTGQRPGTLAEKLSRCKEGMARVFASLPAEALAKVGMVQILLRSGAHCPPKRSGGGVAVQVL